MHVVCTNTLPCTCIISHLEKKLEKITKGEKEKGQEETEVHEEKKEMPPDMPEEDEERKEEEERRPEGN